MFRPLLAVLVGLLLIGALPARAAHTTTITNLQAIALSTKDMPPGFRCKAHGTPKASTTQREAWYGVECTHKLPTRVVFISATVYASSTRTEARAFYAVQTESHTSSYCEREKPAIVGETGVATICHYKIVPGRKAYYDMSRVVFLRRTFVGETYVATSPTGTVFTTAALPYARRLDSHILHRR